ncbi:MAG: AraC family transcriptional regulator [Alteromonadaceae bacterium]|uniref:AraC family transcriptional regulator n=1 Tax=Paraglaciecola mesophila KMM 241 TaxID=1128912 RepID=K6Z8R5_9ALTE|nr:helix-turn-helix domain-containing protein [Paraglaciecola mesophila]MAD18140.1 AraC family transcriptional regulator [Alteromonadaceae bacterium]MBB17921.1 AraC family transcriptional regulator [Rickettsiales bacterium]GAC25363.1 AraC family transcriptional regulator [Paraglaciecola mesophila KMM 241]
MADAKWRVALLIFNGAWASTVYGSMELFHSVNLRRPKDQQFHCDLVSADSQPVQLYGGQSIQGDAVIGDEPYDLIMLAHYWGDFQYLTEQYPSIPPWLAKQHAKGARIAGVNSGIFWAAEAGLLDGGRATTYWRHLREFELRYPKVQWQANQASVEHARIYSSNGQNASMDLSLHLVEKFCGASIAAGLARDISFDSRRTYDLNLINIAGFRQHRDVGIHRAQDWLDEHFTQSVELQALANQIGMSRRTFIRRFQKATGELPSRYLQRLRIEAAKHRLGNTQDSIKTIGMGVGYRDISSFSKVFKSLTDVTPREYRQRLRPTDTKTQI